MKAGRAVGYSHLSFALASDLVCHCRLADGIGAAAGERPDVIFPIAGALAARSACRRARMLPLEFTRYRMRAMLAR